MAKKEIQPGVRINKYISESGFCSRREADKLVDDERVTINGTLATPGSRVTEGDKVRIDGEPVYFIPMEQREYKLRRYGSSRRSIEPEGEEKPKSVNRGRSVSKQSEERRPHRVKEAAVKPGRESRKEVQPSKRHASTYPDKKGSDRGNKAPSRGKPAVAHPATKRRKS